MSSTGTKVWFWSDDGPGRSSGTDTVLVFTDHQHLVFRVEKGGTHH
jgi:hypothetical protein